VIHSKCKKSVGIDIGSTTIKCVLMEDDKIIAEKYQRHMAKIRQTALCMLEELSKECSADDFTIAISGSAGMGFAQSAGIPFVQEVYATGEAVRSLSPDTGTVIELGGEDAKVIFYEGGFDERMNGTCAGGTGAFIDQMAALLNMTVAEMDEASLRAERIYPIASRCGVFAKSDIQPLLNQGASKADITASIYQAVVNQTIVGLIQGRKIRGRVMFLGGPLHYCKGLRKRFVETLRLSDRDALFPEYDRFAVAIGAAIYARNQGYTMNLSGLMNCLSNGKACPDNVQQRLNPLFADSDAYHAFVARHSASTVEERDIGTYSGKAWLGIDCGSTTTKLILIAEDKTILYSYYHSNEGNPVSLIQKQLLKIYNLCGDRIRICGSAVTGYGEELIRSAFHVDAGLVETIAHFNAARYFEPDVDFILDIGGQDIKCFKIKNGTIDSIMLNEACSSGCGSFIEAFAKALGYSVEDFARLGLASNSPVDLGSRCTVFMNSTVKQAQKDGASIEDISAGLSISVVKNAIYKVIRAGSPSELGQHIVVQGGTFLNDAVLRAFELEIGAHVVRPNIAGLMGAYGAALYAMRFPQSSLLDRDALQNFKHTSKVGVCKGCANQCHLTINTFADGQKCISGNQCQKGAGIKEAQQLPNLYEWKRSYLSALKPKPGNRGIIGMPMALSMYELAPLWHGLFTQLGFEVHFSRLSTRKTYEKGQFTIPSDTACYPAKIMHGHIMELIEEGYDRIFYPGLSYNVNEYAGDNHYNCPIVAYYGELLRGNMEELKQAHFLNPYLQLDNPGTLARTLYPCLHKMDPGIGKSEVLRAAKKGFEAYDAYAAERRIRGKEAVKWAQENKKRIMLLAGRPYHIDPEIGHGIDKLAGSLGFVVVSEDSICHIPPVQKVKVLDQWTFHSRLYRAARYAADNEDVELVQLVSFGCGLDAITTDEVRAILEDSGKYYTQIKIDEITNLGAVRLRLRSLLGALEERNNFNAG